MKIKKTADEIWKEYSRGITYNESLNLYENIKQNNNFYNDKQWEGVIAPDLPKPVFNFLKPVVNYYIAMLISDDIATNIEIMGEQDEYIPKMLSTEIDNIMESANVKFKNRKMIKNCAIDGDACFYMWFDTDTNSIKVDLIDNTNVLFGNPSESEVQEQQYILIAYRRLLEDAKDEAAANGVDTGEIVADSDSLYMNSQKDNENDYVTVVLKMWKEQGTVRIVKTTEKAIIKEETDTGYQLYPISFMNWESVKNSYHGVSPLTGKIQNQIFVNKLYAMSMIFTQKMAFPNVLYDVSKFPQGYQNKVGSAIGVSGNPNEALFASYSNRDMSNSVPSLIDSTIRYTKDMMGASDAALGNVRADNTSAIIAVQKAAGLPLEMQRMDFYNFVESYIRIFIDIMRQNYGEREIEVVDAQGMKNKVAFDFANLSDCRLKLNIDIGQGSYFSELMQVQTLDNLMQQKIIPDSITYLENIPDGYIKGKQKIIDKIKQMQLSAQAGEAPMALGETSMPPMNAAQMQQTNMPPNQGEIDDTQIDAIVGELRGMNEKEAMGIISALQVSDETKDLVFELYKRGRQ